jgi:hypothetical protein
MDYSKVFIKDSISVIDGTSSRQALYTGCIPGFMDGYFGFCLMYLFSSPLSVFVLGLCTHFLNCYFIVSYYLLLTKPDIRCLYVLLLFIEIV